LRDGDTRNVVDAYRYWTREAIIADIDTRRHPLHIAIENFGNDANIGTVVRTANAFAVDTVHIVGQPSLESPRRHGDRPLSTAVASRQHRRTAGLRGGRGLSVVAVDNVPGAVRLEDTTLPRELLLVISVRKVPASPTTPGLGRHHGVDRPVRIDAQHQRRRRRRHRDARLDQAARMPAARGDTSASLVGQDLQAWISYGRTGRPAPKPLSSNDT
jgi:hypothetical protein